MRNEYMLAGKVTIPKKHRKEVKAMIQKVLYLGGMRNKETVEINGRTYITAGIPRYDEKEKIYFDYNIFSEKDYERGCYTVNTANIKDPNNYMQDEYELIVNLIRVILEAYSMTPCYLLYGDKPCCIGGYVRVIRSMLGINLTFRNRSEMWKMYYFFQKNNLENITTKEVWEAALSAEDNRFPKQTVHFLTLFEMDAEEPCIPRGFRRLEKEEFEESFTLNLAENVRLVLEEVINVDGREKVYEFLQCLLRRKFKERKELAKQENLYGVIATGSLYLLPAMIVKQFTLITKDNFWKIWDELDIGSGYEDFGPPKGDIETIGVKEGDILLYEAFGRKNEDEFMRYGGDRELKLSYEISEAIERWKRAFSQIEEEEITNMDIEKMLAEIIEDFSDIWHCRLLDTALVKEVLNHKNDKSYKRAVMVLYEIMNKETKYFPELTKREANKWVIKEIRPSVDIQEMNVFVDMLCNHLRRKEILGF